MLDESRPMLNLAESLQAPEKSLYMSGVLDLKKGSQLIIFDTEDVGYYPARYLGRVYPFSDPFDKAEIRIAPHDKLQRLSKTGVDLAPNTDSLLDMEAIKQGTRVTVKYDWELVPAIVFEDSPKGMITVRVHRAAFTSRRGKDVSERLYQPLKTEVRYHNEDLAPGAYYDWVVKKQIGASRSGIPYFQEARRPCYGATNNSSDGISIILSKDVEWINLKPTPNTLVPYTPGLKFGDMRSVIGAANFYPFEQVLITDVSEDGVYDIVSASRPEAKATVSRYQVVETEMRRIDTIMGKRAKLITSAIVQKISEAGVREDAELEAESVFVIVGITKNSVFVEDVGIAQQHWYEVDPALVTLTS